MYIQHNLSAQYTWRKLNENTNRTSKSLQKLASGYRINSAADDAAKLAISEKLRFQITGLETGSGNIEQGLAVSQVGDSALGEVQSMLRRAYELASQASNGTYGDDERMLMDEEVSHLIAEIDRTAKYTQVNHVFPLNFSAMGLTEIPSGDGGEHVDFDKIELNASLLSNGALGSNGAWHLAGVTDEGGINRIWNLVYGSGNTSHSQMRVYVNGASSPTLNVEIKNLTPANYTSSEDPVTGLVTYSLTYNIAQDISTGNPADANTLPADLVHISVTENVTVNPKQRDNQYYTISYEVKNLNLASNAPTVTYDFMHHFDTAYNNNDSVERYYIDGSRVENATIYEGAGLPTNGFSIWGPTSELSFTGSVQYGNTLPDSLFLGHYSSHTPNWNYIDNPLSLNSSISPGTDLGFSMVWKQIGFNANGTSQKKPDLNFGIVRKETDHNIDVNDTDPDVVFPPAPGLWIQASANSKKDGFYLQCCDASAADLGVADVSVATLSDAHASQEKLLSAINTVSLFRGNFGADQNRLIHAQAVNESTSENLTVSESSIRDTDMAKEQMVYLKQNILAQASQSMLAQAIQLPQGLLQLLQ